ncbi:MAG: efflux RND transporter periplasmic adaptor subunit [Planctomycetota bacterium]
MSRGFPSVAVCFLAAVFLSAGCGHKPAERHAPPPPNVSISQPIFKEITDYAVFTGQTDAVSTVQIRARVTGYLDKIFFEAGQEVKTGAPLFLIDPRPYKDAYDAAAAQVELTKAQLQLNKTTLARDQEIAKTPGAMSQQALDVDAAAVAEAAAQVAAAQANLETAKLNLDWTNVTSPIDGRIDRYLLTVGNLVNADTTVLTNIVSQDPIYAYFDIDENTVLNLENLVKEGRYDAKKDIPLGLALQTDTGFPRMGKVDYVKSQLDATTGTLQIRGIFPNPDHFLRPGMFVRVRVPVSVPHQAMLVAEEAIGTDQGLKFVYVVNEQNVAEYRPIELGARQEGGVRVVNPIKIVRTPDGGLRPATAGEKGEDSLRPDEWIVVTGILRVQAGKTVVPKKIPMPVAP